MVYRSGRIHPEQFADCLHSVDAPWGSARKAHSIYQQLDEFGLRSEKKRRLTRRTVKLIEGSPYYSPIDVLSYFFASSPTLDDSDIECIEQYRSLLDDYDLDPFGVRKLVLALKRML